MKIHKTLITCFLTITPLIFSSAITTPVEAGSSPDKKDLLIAAANKSDTVKLGEFKSLEKRTSGDVEIVREDNGRLYIKFDDDFRTQEGPDLFVVLSRSPELQSSGNERRDFYVVSPLLRLKGEQTYILPGDFDEREFNSIAIWCRQMNVVFGTAPLTAK